MPFAFAIVLAFFGTLRLTRFITRDWLGEWLVVAPIKRAAARHEAAVRAGTEFPDLGALNAEFDQMVHATLPVSANMNVRHRAPAKHIPRAAMSRGEWLPPMADTDFFGEYSADAREELKLPSMIEETRVRSDLLVLQDEEWLPHRDVQPELPSEADAQTWPARLAHGLDCPACVGFWIGLGVLIASLVVRTMPKWMQTVWFTLMGALGMNYFVFHVSSRID